MKAQAYRRYACHPPADHIETNSVVTIGQNGMLLATSAWNEGKPLRDARTHETVGIGGIGGKRLDHEVARIEIGMPKDPRRAGVAEWIFGKSEAPRWKDRALFRSWCAKCKDTKLCIPGRAEAIPTLARPGRYLASARSGRVRSIRERDRRTTHRSSRMAGRYPLPSSRLDKASWHTCEQSH